MTNEDRSAILELIDDLRSYTHDWDWKYGAEWDAEIARVRDILTALTAPGEGLYLRTFRHMHKAMYNMQTGELMDACRQCGLDLRDPIHSALATPASAPATNCNDQPEGDTP